MPGWEPTPGLDPPALTTFTLTDCPFEGETRELDLLLKWRRERDAGRSPAGWLDGPRVIDQALELLDGFDALQRQRLRDEAEMKRQG